MAGVEIGASGPQDMSQSWECDLESDQEDLIILGVRTKRGWQRLVFRRNPNGAEAGRVRSSRLRV